VSTVGKVGRDERTVAVERAGSHWALIFLSNCLLLDVAYRGFFRHEAAWDLMALVILSGCVGLSYQTRHHAFAGGRAAAVFLAFLFAASLAFILAMAF
jgi:hypothetical protein